ncbi:unnamed protein product [Periconia digitata]|uniref:NACHT-NTPase and P-loop NTPases N-terminal domain-containing protein n=1 Tax=Periconia digitata TaxID=1303443 RepID=A0A9W4U1P0_9PLEO|nr:unnamed protein product [Periconia digitata]
MAEGLAVVGIVASIVQLVDFGSRVLGRLEEYQSQLVEIPEAYSHIKTELPALLDALRHTQAAIDAGNVGEDSKSALLPVVEGCKVQIQLFDELVAKTLPAPSDSWGRRSGKALKSLWYDAKVEKITLVIRGYIQTLTYHAAVSLRPVPVADQLPPPPYPSPVPSSTVPFRRDPNFVDLKLLAEIEIKLGKPASRLALVGLGGVGKSQLAVEYSYRIREKSPDTWVFWVHASSTARFVEGYRKIAERVKLPRWDQLDADILMLAYTWLSNETNGRWLMIIDNADDIDVFTSKTAGSRGTQDDFASQATPTLLDCIPQSSNGSVLITSRSRDVAFRLTGSYSDVVRVHPMDQAHAVTLLQNQLKGSFDQTNEEEQAAKDLVETLDHMPLAISQAAAYIVQRAPRASVSTYLRDLRRGDQNRAKLLRMDLGDTRRDGTTSNSIMATWQISFEHIRKERPSATRLLSLMSLFHWQRIPEALLEAHYNSKTNDAGTDFEDDLNTLLSYSLVLTDVKGRHLQMHRLVQFSTTKWLELHDELDYWKEKYILLLDKSYPDSEYEKWDAVYKDWKTCQALFPHVQTAVQCIPKDQSALEAWTSLLSKSMVYAFEVGFYVIAQEMGRLALEAREKMLGLEHANTLSSVSLLATALRRGGDFKEAEILFRRAIDGREKILGPEDPLTLSDIDSLGLVKSDHGEYEEAEVLHRKAIHGYKKALGVEHPATLQSLGNLSLVLTEKGSYSDAEVIQQKSLQEVEKIFGPLHKSTLASIDNLGLALGKQGKLVEAEAMHRRALEGSKQTFGEHHPDTLICARNVAFVLALLGRHAEAETLHRQVLEDSIKVLGENHPFTLYSFGNLGSVLHLQGRYQEAETMHRNALYKRKEILGVNHPHSLSSLHNLALTLESLGRNSEAVAYMRECYELRKKMLGPLHPDTQKSLAALTRWEGR